MDKKNRKSRYKGHCVYINHQRLLLFSSRRRHTIWPRDWSSDVCSSDLKNSLNYVEMDNVQAGKLATNHLIDLNHREIVWIGGPLSMTTFAGRYKDRKSVV